MRRMARFWLLPFFFLPRLILATTGGDETVKTSTHKFALSRSTLVVARPPGAKIGVI